MAIEKFNRYEIKYVIDFDVFERLLVSLEPYVVADEYSRNREFYTISNIYYDTANNKFFQDAEERKIFRQKLRLRCYNDVSLDSMVFLEIKKKYNGLVNKRRTVIRLDEAYKFLEEYASVKDFPQHEYINRQILSEIEFLNKFYRLKSKMVLSYDRKAFQGIYQKDLRITFDMNIRSRQYDLRLEHGSRGDRNSNNNFVIMEVKVERGIPLWLSKILNYYGCRKKSFSKYVNEYISRRINEQNIQYV